LKLTPIVPTGLSQPVSLSLPVAIRRIVAALHPEKIILFGSYARGNPTPDSDVDLLVIMRATDSARDRSWAVSRLFLPRPFSVDILVRTPQEIQSAIEKDNFLSGKFWTKGQSSMNEANDPLAWIARARVFYPRFGVTVVLNQSHHSQLCE
jgi:uncharacterized protein